MSDTARQFLRLLEAEQSLFNDELKSDSVGLLLLTAIKEFDFYYYNFVRHQTTEETDEQFHFARLGIPRIIAGALAGIAKFKYPVVTFQSDRRLIMAALEILGGLGFVEHGRRFAHAAMAGECEIVRTSETEFDVILPDQLLDLESIEGDVSNHYKSLYLKDARTLLTKLSEEHGMDKTIGELLEDNVYVFQKKFIGYDADPILDDYFFGVAYIHAQGIDGFDTYHWRAEFGGVTIQKYVLTVIYFLSLAMKHQRFAETLINKHKEIRLRDVLTISCEKEEFANLLVDAINMYGPNIEDFTPITREEADIVIGVLSVRRDNLSMLDTTMAPLPYLLEFSDTAWIKSIAGAELNSFDFLFDSLRYNFPKDYDRNQQKREGSMQRALRRILNEYVPGLTLLDSIVIRKDGKHSTDIDFVAIDEQRGTVLLFQLKHQDHYRGDMRRRSNRSNRLLNQTASWVKKITTWLSESSDREIAATLRRSANFRIEHARLVVLTRHFAHFLSRLQLEEDVAYATWEQFYDALIRLQAEKERPGDLAGLFDVLSEFMTHKMAKPVDWDTTDTYHLRRIAFRVQQASDDER